MSKKSRYWSEEEDQVLKETVIEIQQKQKQKLKWQQIADIISAKTGSHKTGKQCRERWHNQLGPQASKHGEWSSEENKRFIQLQQKYGNKWSKIAEFFEGRPDNTIKNHFYSAMRRGLRKLNNFISSEKKPRGTVKQFKSELVNKIFVVSIGDNGKKYLVKNEVQNSAKKIIDSLLKVAFEESDEGIQSLEMKQQLVTSLGEFSRNCKKKKVSTLALTSKDKNDESNLLIQKESDVINEQVSQNQSPPQKIEEEKEKQANISSNSPLKCRVKAKNSLESQGSISSNLWENYDFMKSSFTESIFFSKSLPKGEGIDGNNDSANKLTRSFELNPKTAPSPHPGSMLEQSTGFSHEWLNKLPVVESPYYPHGEVGSFIPTLIPINSFINPQASQTLLQSSIDEEKYQKNVEVKNKQKKP